jgi:alpha-beta hydrolase superfamily lysophospholipase
MKITKITAKSILNKTLTYEFLSQEHSPSGLVVIFPGLNYTCRMPLLYYAAEVAIQRGFDVLSLSYGFSDDDDSYNTDIAFKDTSEAVKEYIKSGRYENIVFISKSIGTYIAGKLKDEFSITGSLYMTPIKPSLGFILKTDCSVIVGDDDRAISTEDLQSLRDCRNIKLTVIKGAGHSLMIPDNFIKSLDALRVTSEAVDKFYNVTISS